ncbi:hypothetical protein M501DRAFT_941219 [Patellaria atrata CBS 101060]|uniref:CCR4-Not complex 3'-5'-exoribonuclease subunit Ccr4 n=1 Tax=Patellaria atrata CBS 101060 TaxID=1346257 RepID=A0A9P4VPT3_9PEZI|nr:hypothetical protein M501DRAFT_941219 [Patellaria atrata CBS 101060]
MADGPYRFQQGAGHFYYSQHNQQNHHQRHGQRAGSPVNNTRIGGFSNDTPSPSRSPGPQSPAHNTYGMYNQGHHQHGQHGMMNGGTGHQRYAMQMSMSKQYQHQNHHNQGHQHQQAQDHAGHGHGAHVGGHQHNLSSGGMSNVQPHFNQHHMQNGTPSSLHSGLNKPPTEHWTLQLQLAQGAREMTMAHSHARNHPMVNKSIVAGVSSGMKERDKEERNRAGGETNDAGRQKQVWAALDFGGQNLKVISPTLFGYPFLTKLFLNANKLSYLPSAIGRLRNLTQLDLSLNQLTELPPEVGMLVNLRELLVIDNNLETLPFEMGSLYQLEILGVEGNPLHDDFKSIIVEHGTGELIKHLREQAPGPEPPRDRDWISLDDSLENLDDRFSVISWNTLCDKYATQSQYGYTPSAALDWGHRKEVILDEIRNRNADIICLQEVDLESFNDFFRSALAHNDYKGVFWNKSRAKTMGEREAKLVDGCATFYRNKRFILLDKQLIAFGNIAINRPDMKGEHDIFNRVMPRDDIAVVCFFEDRMKGTRLIVVNAHVFWDPVFKDVKVVQVAILMEQITKLAEQYAKWPPCKDKALYRFADEDKIGEESAELPEEPAPSMEYGEGPQIPLIMCGDYNSLPNDSGVYELLASGSLSSAHSDLNGRKYGNFTRDGMSHPFSLRSAYNHVGELNFTNYTPTFTGVIDYIWYSTNALNVTGLLGEIDKEYLQRVPGFPNYHFPSDHLALQAQFSVKGRKEKKIVEADFGPSSRDRRT